MLWDPATLGYLSVYIAAKELRGEAITDGMDVPNVGKITVSDDRKTIVMGPPAEFTIDTVDNYDFKSVLTMFIGAQFHQDPDCFLFDQSGVAF